MELQSLIETYEDIVNRSDDVDLHEIAQRALAEDFRFVGPTVGEVVGREAMLEAMEALYERAPAERIRMNRFCRCPQRMVQVWMGVRRRNRRGHHQGNGCRPGGGGRKAVPRRRLLRRPLIGRLERSVANIRSLIEFET